MLTNMHVTAIAIATEYLQWYHDHAMFVTKGQAGALWDSHNVGPMHPKLSDTSTRQPTHV